MKDPNDIISLLGALIERDVGELPKGSNAKERLRQMRDLRFSLNHQTEEVCHEFISKGGIRALSDILVKEDSITNTQMKEEAIWSITNLSMLSSMYESEFSYAAKALMDIVCISKIDNLASLLNLKL